MYGKLQGILYVQCDDSVHTALWLQSLDADRDHTQIKVVKIIFLQSLLEYSIIYDTKERWTIGENWIYFT
jgi:hypothetical protein